MSNKKNSPQSNYILAFVLSMTILIGYQYLLQYISPAKPAAQTTDISSPATQEMQARQEVAPGASAASSESASSIEPLRKAETYKVENQFYQTEFSTLGGTVTKLIYKGEDAKHRPKEELLFEGDSLNPGIFALRFINKEVDLSKTIFKRVETGPEDLSEVFVHEVAGEYKIEKRFYFERAKPVIHLEVVVENLSNMEKHFPIELAYSLLYDSTDQPNLHHIGAVAEAEKTESADINKIAKKGYTVAKPFKWAGVYKKYFSILVKPSVPVMGMEAKADGKVLTGTIQTQPVTVTSGAKSAVSFLIYAGEQRYETLKSFNEGFEHILSRGFFGVFKMWLLIGLKFLNHYTHNFGWAIILLTLLIKGLFTPLTHLSFQSMKKMQVLQPKLKSLQERYKNDPQKLNREMMELYKRNKVNPMMGCLPLLMQIPIFIAFNQVFGETIELNGAPFIGWISDLSMPDQFFTLPFTLPFLGNGIHILPIFMIASMVWQQKLTPQTAATPEQTKIMNFMPIIFGFMFYSMPSGLVLYWFVNNMLSIIHQIFIKRMIIVLHHEDRE